MRPFGYPVTWSSNIDPENPSGVATWMVEGEKYEFILQSFLDCEKLDKMICEAHQSGRRGGAFKVYDAVTNAVNRTATEAGVDPEWMKARGGDK